MVADSDRKPEDSKSEEESTDELNISGIQGGEILKELRWIRQKLSEKEQSPKEIEKSSDPTQLYKKCKTEMMTSGKWFILKHSFKDVQKMEENSSLFGEEEDHFGYKWKLSIKREEKNVSFYIAGPGCFEESRHVDVNAVVHFEILEDESSESTIVLENNPQRVSNSIDWNDFLRRCVANKPVIVQAHLKIQFISDDENEHSRYFDEKKFSDVALVVADEKFYVSKLYLATHSSYFESLFLGPFLESDKTEVQLFGVDESDFCHYLSLLYGDKVLNELTVEGILFVADIYDTSNVVDECEEFLMEKSEKSTKKKLQMAVRYNLPNLKKKCLSEIKTVADIHSVLPDDLAEMDHSIMTELFRKSLSLH